MEFLSFGKRCISPITSIFQIEVRVKQKNPLSRGTGYKQDSVNIEHQLESKIA